MNERNKPLVVRGIQVAEMLPRGQEPADTARHIIYELCKRLSEQPPREEPRGADPLPGFVFGLGVLVGVVAASALAYWLFWLGDT